MIVTNCCINICPQFCISSTDDNIAPPSTEELGLSLQEKGGALFVVSSLADTIGTMFEAFHIKGPTAPIVTPGIGLIIASGGTGALALALFAVGHLYRDNNEIPTPPITAQQESDLPISKERLIKFSTYGAAYSCAIGGLLDVAGTLVDIFKIPGGKGLIMVSSAYNAAGLLFVLSEGAIRLHHSLPTRSTPTDLIELSGEPSVDQNEHINNVELTEHDIDDAPSVGWDIIEILKFTGSTLFSAGSLLDSVGTVTTHFSDEPSEGSAPTNNNAAYSMLSLACAANVIGLGIFVVAYVVEKYRSSSSNDEVDDNSFSVVTSINDGEGVSLLPIGVEVNQRYRAT